MARLQRLYSKVALARSWRWSHAITITGASGSGTSSAIKHLRELLLQDSMWRWRFLSGGDIMRRKATELGMSIEAFAKFNRNNPHIGHDRDCDDELAAFSRGNYVVLESRLAHILAPQAFHVLLVCSLEQRANRCAARYPGRSHDFVQEILRRRDEDDHVRFSALYPRYDWSPADFDLVIDTRDTTKQDLAPLILAAHAKWLEDGAFVGMTVRGAVLPPIILQEERDGYCSGPARQR